MRCVLIKLFSDSVITLNVTEDTQYIIGMDKCEGVERVINLVFTTPGVRAELIGLYKLHKGQQLKLTTIATHKAPNTSCLQSIKGVLEDGAKSEYVGKIIIEKAAQQTTSFLDQKILVVGEGTVNTSQPILEIEADDVKASHGSTTGRVNPEQIYYLTSRGLDESEAKELIIKGFFESLLSKIEDESIRAAIAFDK